MVVLSSETTAQKERVGSKLNRQCEEDVVSLALDTQSKSVCLLRQSVSQSVGKIVSSENCCSLQL